MDETPGLPGDSVEPQGTQRRLAAILASDMVGYSRLIEADEEGTLARQKAHRKELIDPAIAAYHGRIVKSTGDGLLVEFPSVVDAFRCAVSVQLAMPEREAPVPEAQQITYRVGINLGDIVIDDDDIYGDGVNIAARLEGLAEPGGISVSRTVVDQVKGKVNSEFEDLGAQHVKNLAEPIQVYGVKMQPEAAATEYAEPSPKRTPWRWVAISTALAVIIAVAGVVYWNSQAPEFEPASTERMAYPLPDKPSIAVLPFTNISDDPEQEYFADGMTDDLITDLSEISGLLVIARNSVFLYKDKPVQVQQMAQELGVRYVLEGSMRRADDRVRINAQLIDATTGGHVWAERYDEPVADVFDLQDKVTHKIVTALKVQLTPQEQAVTAGRDTNNVAAYDAFLKGWAHLLKKTPEDAVNAIAFFEQAVELDPNYSSAYGALAHTYWDYSNDVKFNAAVDPPLGASFPPSGYGTYLKAWKFLQKAHSKPSSQTHALAARMFQRQRRFDEATQEARQAVALGPNNPTAYDALIENLIYAGEAKEALRLIDESIQLDPNVPGEKLFLKGMAYYTLGRLEEAVSVINKARSHNPRQIRYAGIQAAALAELDRFREAEVALNEYLSGWTTDADLNWVMFYWPFQDLKTIERVANSFIKVGLRTPLKRYYAVAAQNRLTSEQLKSVLSNKTMMGANRGYFGVVDLGFVGITNSEFEITRDQNLQVISQSDLTYLRTGGQTRIESDLLCDHWLDFLGEYCVAIYRNPDGNPDLRDEYLFFTLMSTFSFSVFDSSSR